MTGVTLAAELRDWPTKDGMAAVLKQAGIPISVGRYSIRLDGHDFAFREFGGDLGQPVVTAEAGSVDALLEVAGRVSEALASARVAHRFEVYSEDDALRSYLHHDWPARPD